MFRIYELGEFLIVGVEANAVKLKLGEGLLLPAGNEKEVTFARCQFKN
jgi:hypothetical protein